MPEGGISRSAFSSGKEGNRHDDVLSGRFAGGVEENPSDLLTVTGEETEKQGIGISVLLTQYPLPPPPNATTPQISSFEHVIQGT